MLLKVNLLPEEQRRSTLSPVEQFHRTPLMWMILGLMAAIPLFVMVPIVIGQQQLRQLNGKIQELEPKRQQVDQLQRTLAKLRAQEAAFANLNKGRDLWSKRLNTLSDVTPNGVWFTELTLEENELVIEGSAVGQTDPGMVTVTRLVQGLKSDDYFMEGVKDIQIESIKRVQEGEIEVVQFTLKCKLAEASSS